MSNLPNDSDTEEITKTHHRKAREIEGQDPQTDLQTSHVQSLFQNQGRSTINNQEHILVSPSFDDPAVEEYSKAGDFTVTQIGSPSENGECVYELRAEGKPPLKITVGRTAQR